MGDEKQLPPIDANADVYYLKGYGAGYIAYIGNQAVEEAATFADMHERLRARGFRGWPQWRSVKIVVFR